MKEIFYIEENKKENQNKSDFRIDNPNKNETNRFCFGNFLKFLIRMLKVVLELTLMFEKQLNYCFLSKKCHHLIFVVVLD